MQDFDFTHERLQCLDDSIKKLDQVNKRLAKLNCLKEELTQMIIASLCHEHEGQRTYTHGAWKLEVKTPFVYSLNKKLYESGDYVLPSEFNPIKESISYSIDKKMCDEVVFNAPVEVIDVLAKLIDKKPGKASVTIKERL